jgi:CBS domain containing-hemolysin-like protein
MIIDVFLAIFLVFINGFFVAAEFAIVKVRVSQIELKSKTGSKSAKLASHIVRHLDGYLAATQLGITLASLGLGWVGEPVVSKIVLRFMELINIEISDQLAHQIALPVAFGIITVLHIVFGELIPKSIAILRSEKTTLLIALPLNIFYWFFKPFIWSLNGIANMILKIIGIKEIHSSEIHNSDELKYLIQQTSENLVSDEIDYQIVKNAFDFSNLNAKQIMIPRNQIIAIDINNYSNKDIDLIIDKGYSRIPCYENSIDNVIGLIYIKDLLRVFKEKKELDLTKLIRPVILISEFKKVGNLLKEFQQKHIHLAVIINEFGESIGIVTMEDVIEELVGEIQDEFDAEISIVEKVNDTTFNVIATATLNDINEFLPFAIENDLKFETLAGVLIQVFGKIPNANEKTYLNNYKVTILKRINNKISLVQLELV